MERFPPYYDISLIAKEPQDQYIAKYLTDIIINDTVISGFTILPQEDLERE